MNTMDDVTSRVIAHLNDALETQDVEAATANELGQPRIKQFLGQGCAHAHRNRVNSLVMAMRVLMCVIFVVVPVIMRVIMPVIFVVVMVMFGQKVRI
jgi:hypothetical protein